MVQDQNGLRLDQSYTIALWVKVDICRNDSVSYLASKGLDSTNNWSLVLAQSTCQVQLIYSDGQANHASELANATALRPNTWYFIAATWDGNTLITYVDSKQDTTNPAPQPPVTGNESVAIGGRDDGRGICECFISNVAIFDFAMSQGSIAKVQRAESLGLSPDSVLGTIPITEILGQGFYQFQPPGNTLTIESSSLSNWSVDVNFTGTRVLVLTELYNNQYVLILDGRAVPISSHVLANGYANGWLLNGTGIPQHIVISDTAQPYFYFGAITSSVFWAIALVFLSDLPRWIRAKLPALSSAKGRISSAIGGE